MTDRLSPGYIITRGSILALVIALVWAFLFIQDALSKGTRTFARWTCPCMFYEQRDFEYCLATLPGGDIEVPGFMKFDIDTQEQRVTVSALGIAEATAVRVPGRQCVLER
ncbi:MAG: hypothetical protein AAGI88_00115 [Pseudomonadota bacterium]